MKNGNWDDKIRTAYDHATPDVLDRIPVSYTHLTLPTT